MQSIADPDLQALCEICADDNMSFGQTSKLVREEVKGSMRQAIELTYRGLHLAATHGRNIKAERAIKEWPHAKCIDVDAVIK